MFLFPRGPPILALCRLPLACTYKDDGENDEKRYVHDFAATTRSGARGRRLPRATVSTRLRLSWEATEQIPNHELFAHNAIMCSVVAGPNSCIRGFCGCCKTEPNRSKREIKWSRGCPGQERGHGNPMTSLKHTKCQRVPKNSLNAVPG